MAADDTLLGGQDDTDPADKGTDDADKGTDDANADKGTDDADKGDAKSEPLTSESFKFAEGVEVNKEALEVFVKTANEAGLNAEQAQKFVDLQMDMAKKQVESLAAERKTWVEGIKSDPEFGGAQYEKSLETARRAMQQFASPELRALLNATGFGDHPEVFRLMVKIGKAMGEAKFTTGDQDKDKELTPEDRIRKLYKA